MPYSAISGPTATNPASTSTAASALGPPTCRPCPHRPTPAAMAKRSSATAQPASRPQTESVHGAIVPHSSWPHPGFNDTAILLPGHNALRFRRSTRHHAVSMFGIRLLGTQLSCEESEQWPAVVALASGSASSMSNISKSRLATLPIELPPITLQYGFSDRIAELRRLRNRCEQAVASHSDHCASLTARAFSGQL
jgi:hypothetical protein